MNRPPEHLVAIQGFGGKGLPELVDALMHSVRFPAVHIFAGCPPEKGHIPPDQIVEELDARIPRDDGPMVFIGHSWGGPLGEGVAFSRRQMKDIGLFIDIDAPANPDVLVQPYSTHAANRFAPQYRDRVEFTRKSQQALMELPSEIRANVLTIGTQVDNVVPPDAKKLPGIQHIDLPLHIQGHPLDVEGKIDALVEIIAPKIINVFELAA